ncbi:metal ABC transporter solute-binding protein, Zn/Mn family [Microbacterium sp. P05]|uniref:metal ABC transporter solute-binding protein, Zn/Mn family n=1 Tax=Microbacterium sp. P05 TaxID=3366948 RepID=UPI003746C535
MTPTRLASAAALAAASVLVLAGCAGASASSDDGRLQVLASTNVYGQIVQEIGGDAVDVTSLITSGAQDPHSFEPSAQDQLAVSNADLIVENGGGYDSFVESLVSASGTDAPVITAAEYSHDWPGNAGHAEDSTEAPVDEAPSDEPEHSDDDGHDHIEGFNEHVWYDPHTVEHVAEAIADELSSLAPDDAATFSSNLDAFTGQIGSLESSLTQIEETDAGASIFVTEPVPLYLTGAAGLVNVTPEAFSEAVEEGQDVPPATLLEALGLLESGEVRVVIVNAQTGGAETTQIVDTAEGRGIPVLEFAETLPEGQTYISWMNDNVAQLAAALAE